MSWRQVVGGAGDVTALLRALAVRNLLRGYHLALPTGQAVAEALGAAPRWSRRHGPAGHPHGGAALVWEVDRTRRRLGRHVDVPVRLLAIATSPVPDLLGAPGGLDQLYKVVLNTAGRTLSPGPAPRRPAFSPRSPSGTPAVGSVTSARTCCCRVTGSRVEARRAATRRYTARIGIR
jgi:hypothetical protein